MSYEMIVGLQVKDAAGYQEYRRAMKGLLEEHGGGFRYDFWIKETLKSESPDPINRVFAIYFRDKASMDAFFAHPNYKKIRQNHFETSVESTTLISQYER